MLLDHMQHHPSKHCCIPSTLQKPGHHPMLWNIENMQTRGSPGPGFTNTKQQEHDKQHRRPVLKHPPDSSEGNALYEPCLCMSHRVSSSSIEDAATVGPQSVWYSLHIKGHLHKRRKITEGNKAIKQKSVDWLQELKFILRKESDIQIYASRVASHFHRS